MLYYKIDSHMWCEAVWITDDVKVKKEIHSSFMGSQQNLTDFNFPF